MMVKNPSRLPSRGEKQSSPEVVATYIDEYSDEDEAFGIDRTNLADPEWYYEPSTGRRVYT